MAKFDSEAQYQKLFPTDAVKAAAFDRVAELFFNKNFGTASKSDIDVLMFSMYIDKILEQSEGEISTYSDYTLSKYLGITQSKVKSLKIKKELIYPREEFCWENSFRKIYSNAQYKDGNILLFVPDPNLYIELKHFIEENNGLVDIRLNSSLLVVSLESFLDLVVYVADESEKNVIRNFLKDKFIERQANVENFEKQPISKTIGQSIGKICLETVFEELSKVPGICSVSSIIKKTVDLIKEAQMS